MDMPESTPGPARRVAGHLYGIVRAATAGDAGVGWMSALSCRRRPGHRRCPGWLVVSRPDPPGAIRWRCSHCGDRGLVTGWEGTPFDLRRSGLTLTRPVVEVPLTVEVAATLRGLRLLDAECERLVYRIRVREGQPILFASEDELEELGGYVAAEANHEPNRRRQRALDGALDVLSDGGVDAAGW